MLEGTFGTPGKVVASIIVSLLIVGQAHGQVDLTPIPSTYELDGAVIKQLEFRDGTKKIIYQPPSTWRASGAGYRFTIVPNVDGADAEIFIRAQPLRIPMDAEGQQRYAEIAKGLISREAKEVEVLGSKLNPLRICGHETLEVEFKYQLFGSASQTNVLFLSRPSELWVFRFTSRQSDYPKTSEAFRKSLYSLQGL